MDTRLFARCFAGRAFETKRTALIGAVVSFAALFAVYDMSERLSIGGIAWVTIPIGATLLLPFLFGLFAWSRGDVTDLLVVSAIGGFATGLGTFAASVKNTYEFADQFDQPWPFSFGELASTAFASVTRGLTAGLVLALAFAVYQLWPQGQGSTWKRRDALLVTALVAIAGAVVAYVAMHFMMEWLYQNPASNVRIYPQYAILLATPILFALSARTRSGDPGMLGVGLVTSLALAAPAVVRTVEQVREFGGIPLDIVISITATNVISTVAMGMAPVLAFVAWRFWKLDNDINADAASFARPLASPTPPSAAGPLGDPAPR